MPSKSPIRMTDAISWAKRINDRWIVRISLRDSANRYMDHLATIDPGRLEDSSLCARKMTEMANSGEDPKPWFYSGLFSLITEAESDLYLSDHHFTLAAISKEEPTQENVSDETFEKIRRIRENLLSLDSIRGTNAG
jgi:hypothetical protein